MSAPPDRSGAFSGPRGFAAGSGVLADADVAAVGPVEGFSPQARGIAAAVARTSQRDALRGRDNIGAE